MAGPAGLGPFQAVPRDDGAGLLISSISLIAAAPTCGKSTWIQELRAQGIDAIDTDELLFPGTQEDGPVAPFVGEAADAFVTGRAGPLAYAALGAAELAAAEVVGSALAAAVGLDQPLIVVTNMWGPTFRGALAATGVGPLLGWVDLGDGPFSMTASDLDRLALPIGVTRRSPKEVNRLSKEREGMTIAVGAAADVLEGFQRAASASLFRSVLTLEEGEYLSQLLTVDAGPSGQAVTLQVRSAAVALARTAAAAISPLAAAPAMTGATGSGGF